MKVFTIFSWFEVWYIKILVLHYIKGGKTSKLKSRKNRWKFTFSTIFSTRPIIFAKGMAWNNVQLSKIFFWKTSAIWYTLMCIVCVNSQPCAKTLFTQSFLYICRICVLHWQKNLTKNPTMICKLYSNPTYFFWCCNYILYFIH